jgi:MFS family permease
MSEGRAWQRAIEPLATPIFRWVWVAAMASNVGTWMQNVGAAWLMVTLSSSPLLIALVQTATTLPVFAMAIPAGVLTDLMDRRRLLLVTQSWMLVCAALLGALTLAGSTGPWTLLALTFALGLGNTLNGPAWQATVPRLVPREQLPSAIALNSVQFNIARAVGPALGGLIVSVWSPGAAFVLNAVSFCGVLFVLWKWKGEQEPLPPAETVGEAVRAGVEWVRRSSELHAVFTRTGTFALCASALWALLPVVAKAEISSTSSGYGILLGCLGAGSVIGAGVFARLRHTVNADHVVAGGSLVFAAAIFSLGFLTHFELLCLAMVAGGIAWMSVMSTFNVSTQIVLPGWVRGRALSCYLLVFQGSLAIGSWLWGEVALRWGTRVSLSAAGTAMVAGLAAAARFRLREIREWQMTAAMRWPEPAVQTDLESGQAARD